MIKTDNKYIKALNTILEDIDYIFFIKNMRGYLEFIDPWSDYDKIGVSHHQLLLALFQKQRCS